MIIKPLLHIAQFIAENVYRYVYVDFHTETFVFTQLS